MEKKGKYDANSNVEFGTKEKEEESDQNSLDAAIAKQFASAEKDTGCKLYLKIAGKLVGMVCMFYFFVISLDLMGTGFQLATGKVASSLFADSELFNNPFFALMVGVLGTVAVQSSSTFTSIVVSMVTAGSLEVHMAVPIVIGANIGTSVTNTIVAMTQVNDKETFRRAFSGATVHDMFNWCAVIVLLTVEVLSYEARLFPEGQGFLEYLAGECADALVGGSAPDIDILKVITEPLTHFIIQTEKDVLSQWANGTSLDKSMQKCHEDALLPEECCTWISGKQECITPEECLDPEDCRYLFHAWNLSDVTVGVILIVFSILLLCTSLIGMVKLLTSLLQGAMAVVVRKVINPQFKSAIGNYFYGYFNITIGAVLTFCVQSSSVFTSALTPLVGIGLISVDTIYPLFLGANIGTTTTSLLASLAGSGQEAIREGLQISFVHLLFNVFGILLYYPIPFMRIPLPLCKILGNTTAEYRWFAIMYLVVMFLLLPGFIMAISLNDIAFMVIGIPFLVLLVFVVTVNIMQRKCSKFLPEFLRSWNFLPQFMHSLEPYDKVITGWRCCKKCTEANVDLETGQNGEKNLGYESD